MKVLLGIHFFLILTLSCCTKNTMTDDEFLLRAKRSLENTVLEISQDPYLSEITYEKIQTNHPNNTKNLYLRINGDDATTEIYVRVAIGPFHGSKPIAGDIKTLWKTQVQGTEVVIYTSPYLRQVSPSESNIIKTNRTNHVERHTLISQYLQASLQKERIMIKKNTF